MEGGAKEDQQEVLRQVLDASLYTPMTKPGALQPSHFLPPFSPELVLVTLPDAVNPMNLINSELVVGGRKDSLLVAGKHRYRVSTYPTGPDTCLPSLFLPDQDGRLTKVTSDVTAFLVVKEEEEVKKEEEEEGEEEEGEGKSRVDIDALRSLPCKLPKDLRRRNFYGKSPRLETSAENIKPSKRKKKTTINPASPDTSVPPSADAHSPRKRRRDEASPPAVRTPGSPARNKEKRTVLPDAEELQTHVKRFIKKEKL